MIVNELKKSIYLAAFQGKLSSHYENDSNVNEQINKIIIDKKIDLKERKRRKITDDYLEPYKIPNSWKWVKLGYLCDVIRGLTFSSSSNIKKDNNILVLRGGNIDSKSEELVFDDNIYVDYSIPNENQYLQNGDTLIVASSGTKTSVGKSALIHDINNNISFGGFMMVVRPYCEIANQKYISYQIKMYRNKIINDTNGYISNITNEILNNLLIPLPPIEEQQRIVTEIEELFEKIDEIKPIEEELTYIKEKFPIEMKNSILKEAFDGKYSLDSDWQNDKLSNVCNEICTGNSISESIKKSKYTNIELGYNYIGTKDLDFNHIFNYEKGVKIPFEELNFKYANMGDVLLCIEGGSAGKKIGILTEKVCFGNKLCKFSSTKLNSKFLYYYLQSPQFTRDFYDNLSGIIGGVSINKIRTLEISYPSIEEQQKIVDKIEVLLPLCDDIDKIVGEK